jgi:hypothetical protein
LKFTNKNYPKTTASSSEDYFRLKKLYENNPFEIEIIENELWNFLVGKEANSDFIENFKTYEFIDHGWEWSVFKFSVSKVIKIPSGIFEEVNSLVYLNNVRKNYQKISEIFPKKNFAESEFKKETNLNRIFQEYIPSSNNFYTTPEFVINLVEFILTLLQFLKIHSWIPDIEIRIEDEKLLLRNILIQNNSPVIYDFSTYYDVFRLYPERTEKEVIEKTKELNEAVSILKNLKGKQVMISYIR